MKNILIGLLNFKNYIGALIFAQMKQAVNWQPVSAL